MPAALIAGCGGPAAGGEDDPATLVPANAPIYIQAAVRPSGDRADGVHDALVKIMRTDDPGGKITALLDESLADDHLDWDRDFAPWVGEEAGIWLSDAAISSSTDADTPAAAIIQVTDEGAAAKSLPRIQGNGTQKSYKGVEYWVDVDDGTVAGLVDGFVVVGTEAEFQRTVDAANGDTLSESSRYRDAVDELPGDRLGFWFLDLPRLIDIAAKQDPASAQQLEQARAFVPFDKLGPLVGSVQADGSSVTVDSVLTGVPDGVLRQLAGLYEAGDSSLLESMPADAWGGLAVPDVGEHSRALLSAGAGAIGAAAISAQLRQATGLDVDADLFSWMGDMAFFVRGETVDTLDGALVVESTDDDRAAAAFGKIVGVIAKQAGAGTPQPVQIDGAESAVAFAAPDAPAKVVLARGKGRVVVALGERAAADGLGTEATLGSSELWKGAEGVLGDDYSPSLVLSMPAILKLVEASSSGDADFQAAEPYLEAFGTIAAGANADDDKLSSRFGVSLK